MKANQISHKVLSPIQEDKRLTSPDHSRLLSSSRSEMGLHMRIFLKSYDKLVSNRSRS